MKEKKENIQSMKEKKKYQRMKGKRKKILEYERNNLENESKEKNIKRA